ncbi:MAG: hypothetical protein ACTSVI_01600 [Promethearchaeota archaeon]
MKFQNINGISYYDLQKKSAMPPTKIYRCLKVLEEKNLLEKKSIKTGSRPKYLYSLNHNGVNKLNELKDKIILFFKKLNEDFPIPDFSNFNVENVLESSTLVPKLDPIDELMKMNISKMEKLNKLKEIEERLTIFLDKIKEKRKVLEE